MNTSNVLFEKETYLLTTGLLVIKDVIVISNVIHILYNRYHVFNEKFIIYKVTLNLALVNIFVSQVYSRFT